MLECKKDSGKRKASKSKEKQRSTEQRPLPDNLLPLLVFKLARSCFKTYQSQAPKTTDRVSLYQRAQGYMLPTQTELCLQISI